MNLSLGDSFIDRLINLPETLEPIKLGNGFTSKIIYLLSKLKLIIFSSKCKYLDEFVLI